MLVLLKKVININDFKEKLKALHVCSNALLKY